MRFLTPMIVVLAASIAHAQPDATSEADRLFDEGRDLAQRKRYAEACDRFTRSFAIDPSLGTQLNLADCKEALGERREAWRLFVEVAEASARAGDNVRADFARKRANAVRARLAKLVIHVAAPAGLELVVAGRKTAAAAEVTEVVDPGRIEVVATAPGQPRFRKVVSAAAGATVELSIPRHEAAVDDARDPSRVRIAWILGSTGGVAMLGAAALTWKARSDYNNIADGPNCDRTPAGVMCNETGASDIERAGRVADFGTVLAVAGGLSAVAAVVVYVTAPRTGVTITPAISSEHVSVTLTTAF